MPLSGAVSPEMIFSRVVLPQQHPTTSRNDQAMMASGWTLSRAEVMAPPMPLFVVSTSPITASFHPPPMTISRAELK